MGEYSSTFDWVQFPEGRARFSGGIRGGDEIGHETFAVDVDGVEYFGEIGDAFLPNGNDYDIEIISFGYGTRDNVGNPLPEARGAFPDEQLGNVKLLIKQLVRAGLSFKHRPFVLGEDASSRFMGEIIFRDGWARRRTSESLVLQASWHDAGDMP